MNITPQSIPDVWLISPRKFGDDRGFFSETFRKSALAEMGFERDFVQDNHSMSGAKGTVRGLHFQLKPHQQDKLVRVVHGAILDVAVDIRPGSPTFGRHLAVELSAGNWDQLLVPRGFAHGFQTLTENCEVLYKVTDYYAPQAERGLLWCDPALDISWQIAVGEAVLNDRDAAWPKLSDLALDAGANPAT